MREGNGKMKGRHREDGWLWELQGPGVLRDYKTGRGMNTDGGGLGFLRK